MHPNGAHCDLHAKDCQDECFCIARETIYFSALEFYCEPACDAGAGLVLSNSVSEGSTTGLED